ncbi:MAG: hypothetical protein AAF754_17845 [Pseudomonadota bacterium]
MGIGIGAIALSIICLVASLAFGAPGWVNILGLVAGVAGLFLLGRAKKAGNGE